MPDTPIDISNADLLLSTTRSVRKRLDLERPVPREVILECVRMAVQAPTASNGQGWRWMIVTDPEKRAGLADVPVHVIPCIEGRVNVEGNISGASFYGSIMQASWSFMLALRARGLGSVWTTLHLQREQEAAELLGIPFESVSQIALLPVAYTVGTDFKPAARGPVEDITYWDEWGA